MTPPTEEEHPSLDHDNKETRDEKTENEETSDELITPISEERMSLKEPWDKNDYPLTIPTTSPPRPPHHDPPPYDINYVRESESIDRRQYESELTRKTVECELWQERAAYTYSRVRESTETLFNTYANQKQEIIISITEFRLEHSKVVIGTKHIRARELKGTVEKLIPFLKSREGYLIREFFIKGHRDREKALYEQRRRRREQLTKGDEVKDEVSQFIKRVRERREDDEERQVWVRQYSNQHYIWENGIVYHIW